MMCGILSVGLGFRRDFARVSIHLPFFVRALYRQSYIHQF